MVLLGDYHTHTPYSHGKGTILDNAFVAKEKGLKQIAITDHGFGHVKYGMKPRDIEPMRKEIEIAQEKTGVKILLGIEANFISLDGTIDLTSEQLSWFDVIVCGFHYAAKPKSFGDAFGYFLPNYSPFKPTKRHIQRNTEAIMRSLDKYPIDVISHMGYACPVDFCRLARHCRDCGTYVELNGKRINFGDEELLQMQSDNVKLIVNSDAHRAERVGECNQGINMITRLEINPDLVVNIDKIPTFKTK